jgi:hypothetical protein
MEEGNFDTLLKPPSRRWARVTTRMSPEIGGDAILENGLARSDSFILTRNTRRR